MHGRLPLQKEKHARLIRASDIVANKIPPRTFALGDGTSPVTACCTVNGSGDDDDTDSSMLQYLYAVQGNGTLLRLTYSDGQFTVAQLGTVASNVGVLFFVRRVRMAVNEDDSDDEDVTLDLLGCMSDFGVPEFVVVGDAGIHQRVQYNELTPVLDVACVPHAVDARTVLYACCGQGTHACIKKIQYGMSTTVLSESDATSFDRYAPVHLSLSLSLSRLPAAWLVICTADGTPTCKDYRHVGRQV